MKIFLPLVMGPQEKRHKDMANSFYNLLKTDPRQKRLILEWSSTLESAAYARAESLAKRRYFAHCDPDGKCPNQVVREFGFVLPPYYGNGNDIESLGGGTLNPQVMWKALSNSEGHAPHMLGLNQHFVDQDKIGIAAYELVGSPHSFYFVVLIAKEG